MLTKSQRAEMLLRRMDLVREYTTLQCELVDLYFQFTSLRYDWHDGVRPLNGDEPPATAGTGQRRPNSSTDVLSGLKLLTDRIHTVCLRTESIVLEQRKLHALESDSPPPRTQGSAPHVMHPTTTLCGGPIFVLPQGEPPAPSAPPSPRGKGVGG